jgi:hypothetical protein
MSDVKNLYTLKQPVKAELVEWPTPVGCKPGDWRYWHVHYKRTGWGAEEYERLTQETFDALFQPLDVESLTTQLENILEEVYEAGFTAQHEKSARRGLTILGSTSAVLDLIGMKGKDDE